LFPKLFIWHLSEESVRMSEGVPCSGLYSKEIVLNERDRE